MFLSLGEMEREEAHVTREAPRWLPEEGLTHSRVMSSACLSQGRPIQGCQVTVELAVEGPEFKSYTAVSLRKSRTVPELQPPVYAVDAQRWGVG